VPFDKDAKFIGREDILIEIDKKFKVQRRVALAGIGGVGWVCLTMRVGIKTNIYRKSQIAIEYCYKFRDQRPESHVFWIHVSTVSRMDQAYKDIARKLGIPGCNESNIDTFQLVLELGWLSDDAHGP
jgi:hypothetical protein